MVGMKHHYFVPYFKLEHVLCSFESLLMGLPLGMISESLLTVLFFLVLDPLRCLPTQVSLLAILEVSEPDDVIRNLAFDDPCTVCQPLETLLNEASLGLTVSSPEGYLYECDVPLVILLGSRCGPMTHQCLVGIRRITQQVFYRPHCPLCQAICFRIIGTGCSMMESILLRKLLHFCTIIMRTIVTD